MTERSKIHTHTRTTHLPGDATAAPQRAVTALGQVRDPGLGAMIEVRQDLDLVNSRRFEAGIPSTRAAA